jgi:hypothetical protein
MNGNYIKLLTIYAAPDEMIDILKQIVDKIQMKGGFDPNNFNNPGKQFNIYFYFYNLINCLCICLYAELGRFYDVLQALAFDKEVPPGVEDLTIPKYTTINKVSLYLFIVMSSFRILM